MAKYVLSLDGGGVRELQLLYLFELEKRLKKPLFKFDLVVGTSTGGILLVISVLKLRPRLLEIYSGRLKNIFTILSSFFRTKYSGDRKMEVLHIFEI